MPEVSDNSIVTLFTEGGGGSYCISGKTVGVDNGQREWGLGEYSGASGLAGRDGTGKADEEHRCG